MKATIRPGLVVWAFDPEVEDGFVVDCAMRATHDDELTAADEHAIEAWLHSTYYPHVLREGEEDG